MNKNKKYPVNKTRINKIIKKIINEKDPQKRMELIKQWMKGS